MDAIETTLKTMRLRRPSEALRGQVLASATPAPPEWKRLAHTLEGCAVALLVVAGWCLWFEHGSESLRQECRIMPADSYRREIEERLVAQAKENPIVYEYAVAMLMEAYTKPYVVRPES